MGKIKDLSGQHFGKLTVIEDTGERKNRQVVWLCQCECGNTTKVVGQSLRSGHTTSCGCKNFETKAENLIGQKFFNLTVIERAGSSEHRAALWKCKCICGNERIVTTSELKNGDAKACRECASTNPNFNYSETIWYKKIYNHTFGRLQAIEPTDNKDNAGHIIWKCKCSCGNPNDIFVASNRLITGNTQSCGCLFGKSKGEEEIEQLLQKNKIKYVKQKTFEDLKSPKDYALRYDFFIPAENILIEYDGIQHQQPIEYFGGADGYNYLKICDEIKNNYAIQHSLKLIRIPLQKSLKDLELMIKENKWEI